MLPKSRVRKDYFYFIYNEFYLEPYQKPLSLAVLPLDTTNDIFFNEKHERITGKYRVVTKAFTGGSPKFEAVQVHWDNVVDWFKTNCVDVEQLGLTLQIVSKTSFALPLPFYSAKISLIFIKTELKRNPTKKRTHLSTQETIVSNTVRMYFKFHFV